MTKGQIIESVLEEMRATYSHKIRRPNEEDEEEQEVIAQLGKLLRDAAPDEDILTCADFTDLNLECCTTCHYFMYPFDFSQGVRLKNGEYAWVCCAIGSAVNRAGRLALVKRVPAEERVNPAGYKPFADLFGGSKANNAK
jgi:hypothetical protein